MVITPKIKQLPVFHFKYSYEMLIICCYTHKKYFQIGKNMPPMNFKMINFNFRT